MQCPLVGSPAAACAFAFLCFVGCGGTAFAADASFTETAAAEKWLSLGQYDRAIHAYRTAEAGASDDRLRATAHLGIAEALGKKGDHLNARSTFKEVAGRYPRQTLLACRALVRSGDYALADKALDGAIADYDRVVTEYAGSADATAKDLAAQAAVHISRIRVRLANNARYRAGDSPKSAAEANAALAEAQASLRRIIDGFPKSGRWVSEAKLDLLELQQQSALFGAGGTQADVVQAATAYIGETANSDQSKATARLIRAESCFFAGRYREAIADSEQIGAAGATPAVQGTALRLLGQCYERTGEYGKAAQAYTTFLQGMKSFKAWIDRPLAGYGLGMCLRALGRGEEASAALQAVVRDYPKSPIAAMASVALNPPPPEEHAVNPDGLVDDPAGSQGGGARK